MSESIQKDSWQQKTIEKLLFETLKEQKRSRRWKIFFRLIFWGFILSIFIIAFTSSKPNYLGDRSKPHTSLIKIRGEIADGGSASADSIVKGINRAFRDPNTRGILLSIDSPGGSPVQASMIYNEVVRLKQKYPAIKVYAACTDVCASAAYYIASSADYIYANQSSIVGSIGVLMDGFGFVDTMQKVGVQRRLVISGDEKGFMDPFSPLKPQDLAYAQSMLNIVHQQFIAAVQKGRGNRLKNDPQLFSGLAWTGVQAQQLGLIDGFASPGTIARDIIKQTNVVDYTTRPDLLDQLSKGIGASFYHSFAENVGLEGITLR